MTAGLIWCACDNEERKPFTPFGVASALKMAPAPSATAAAPPEEQPFVKQKAQRHSPPRQTLNLDERTIEAPSGLAFSQTLRAQFGEDSAPTLLGWMTPKPVADKPGTRPRPGLWAFGPETSRELEALPGFIPSGAGCSLHATLRQTGQRSASLTVEGKCKQASATRVATKALVVVAPNRENPRLQLLRLAPALPDEQLSLTVNSQDQDGDGHDDVRVRVTLKAKGTKRESSAVLAWLERPAGLSRDLGATTRSFTEIGSIEVVRSKGKKTSSEVHQRLANARRLFAYLCAEGGTPAVTNADGDPIQCGNLDKSRDFFARAEVQASLTQGDVLQGLWAIARSDWYGGPIGSRARSDLEQLIRGELKTRRTTLQETGVSARAPSGAPRYSPLSFTDDETLLVLTSGGITRLQDGQAEDASAEIDPWPLRPLGPGGELLQSASLACNEATVSLVGAAQSGRLLNVARSNILAPRPGYCGRSATVKLTPPRLRPIAWGPGGVSALLDARWLGPKVVAGPRGSPLSPNGRHLVIQTAGAKAGIVVRKGRDTPSYELWQVNQPLSLSDCVINNAASRVACLRGQSVLMLSLP